MPVKEAKLLEGKILAKQIQEEIHASVQKFKSKGLEAPKLCALQIGKDASAEWYLGQQQKLAQKLGLEYELIAADGIPDQKTLLARIADANRSSAHGIFMTMPLPKGFDADAALLALDPKKDVEGIHPTSLGLIVLRKAKLIPPTAYAAFQLIESTGLKLHGKQAVLVGQSAIVGRPLQLMLGERRVTTLVCNTGTPAETIQKFVEASDIVIACAGQPGIVKGAWIREGQIVIDVGTTEVNGKITGDIEFEEARKRAAFITPVPGGVGPLTVTMLMRNLIHAYRWQKGL